MEIFMDDGKRTGSEYSKGIKIEEALKEIGMFPTEEEYDGGFIGLSNDKKEVIQFIRFEKDSWLLDVPVIKKGEFLGETLQDDDVTTSTVKEIISRFFENKDFFDLCELKSINSE